MQNFIYVVKNDTLKKGVLAINMLVRTTSLQINQVHIVRYGLLVIKQLPSSVSKRSVGNVH